MHSKCALGPYKCKRVIVFRLFIIFLIPYRFFMVVVLKHKMHNNQKTLTSLLILVAYKTFHVKIVSFVQQSQTIDVFTYCEYRNLLIINKLGTYLIFCECILI